MAILYVFPDGRFFPRQARPMLVVIGAVAVAWILFPASPFNLAERYTLPPASFGILMLIVFASIGAQVYRFSTIATPMQRQQTKWVLFGIALQVFGFALFGVARTVLRWLPDRSYEAAALDLIGAPLALLVAVFIPFGYLFSILRYRLWDIDVLINRALVYGTLTALLSGLYVASIGFIQRLFVATTGNPSEAAIVLTTLIVASAFTPLKNRLQATVDRYVKEAPDATTHIRAFRDEVHSLIELLDPSLITRRALDEIAVALDAESGAVYVRDDGTLALAHTHGEWVGDERLRVQLHTGDVDFGVIALGPRHNGRDYSPSDKALIEDVASQVATAMSLLSSSRSAGRPRRQV
jgi:hypothetical protein